MESQSEGWNLLPRSAMAASVIGAVLIALLDLVSPTQFILPIAYAVPVAIAAWSRRPSFLWSLVIAVSAATYLDILVTTPGARSDPTAVLFNRSLVVLSTVLAGLLVHLWIRLQQDTERARDEIDAANRSLAEQKDRIASQNQALQDQTRETERTSEQLRAANDTLAVREETLRSLLTLSRSLTVELTPSETMERICQTLSSLVNGPSTATAILLRDGDDLVVRCHYGFGEQGLRQDRFPVEVSFAGVTFQRGQSGYIEDIALRPELQVPQPKHGDPIVSILAVPLTVSGRAMGTLEVYSRHRRTWPDQQIALAESLAAQATISFENAQLFQDIEHERRRLIAVLRAVPFAILICNENCTEIRANPAGAALLKVQAETALTPAEAFAHVQAFRNGATPALEEHPLLVAARTGREVHGEELEWMSSQDQRVYVLASAVPIRDRDNRIAGAISVKADITQLKTLQRELDVRRREAEEASVRKTRFLAAASHDIRTPANAIGLIAELIKRTSDNPASVGEVAELAGELHQTATSLVNLVSNVLDVTRFESGGQDLVESDFPLSNLIDEEVRQTQPLAQAKQLDCQVQQNEPLLLRTDRVKLGRVIGNLLGNAIKFTDRGHVRIESRRITGDGGGVEIKVSDSGVGIAPEHQQRIFDEFFQLSDPQRSKGSGLGLAISRRLVETMGGTLIVQSEPGRGSTFTITLPAGVIIGAADESTAPALESDPAI